VLDVVWLLLIAVRAATRARQDLVLENLLAGLSRQIVIV